MRRSQPSKRVGKEAQTAIVTVLILGVCGADAEKQPCTVLTTQPHNKKSLSIWVNIARVVSREDALIYSPTKHTGA